MESFEVLQKEVDEINNIIKEMQRYYASKIWIFQEYTFCHLIKMELM
jgi:hypothetical protein